MSSEDLSGLGEGQEALTYQKIPLSSHTVSQMNICPTGNTLKENDKDRSSENNTGLDSDFDNSFIIDEPSEESYFDEMKRIIHSSDFDMNTKFTKLFELRFGITPRINRDKKLKAVLLRKSHLSEKELMTYTQRHLNEYGGYESIYDS